MNVSGTSRSHRGTALLCGIAFACCCNVGDPGEVTSYRGFNGLEAEVVTRIAEWILR